MAAEEKVKAASRYKVRRSIGKGSYGEVFLVTHRADRKQVGSLRLGYTHGFSDLLQYVMKNIKLTASSAKERRAAEQEVSYETRGNGIPIDGVHKCRPRFSLD